jgi:hypothetical protein
VAVVISSLLLGGCFVSYRTGALHWLTKPGDSESSRSTKESGSDGSPSTEPTFMSGSKSFTPDRFLSGLTPAETFTPDTAKQPPRDTAKKAPPAATQREPMFMGGPKSAPVFIPPPHSNISDPPPASSERWKPGP